MGRGANGKQEREKAAEEEEARERDVAGGNPLLGPKQDFGVKRRWDDDVIFRNQARGTEGKDKKEFVNVSSFEPVVGDGRWKLTRG